MWLQASHNISPHVSPLDRKPRCDNQCIEKQNLKALKDFLHIFKFSPVAILKMAAILNFLYMHTNRLIMFYLCTKFQSSSYFIVFIMNFSNFRWRPFWKWRPSWKISNMRSDRLIMVYLCTKFQSSSYFIVFIMNFSNFRWRPFWKWRPYWKF